ncbi:MAG: ferrochelatase [Elusimicrobia bacterium]|nr:ferrochelatase [Elusimicrobiota bacterium]
MDPAAGPVGVALLTMGEPESQALVRPFLRQLLSDREMVLFPLPALQPAFAWLVSTFASGRLRGALARIGGGSPLVRLTTRQAEAMEAALRPDGDFKVYPVMRYGRPSAENAVRKMRDDGVRRVLALPLYPQYCAATTGSSLKDLAAAMGRHGLSVPVAEARSWPDHPGYVSALCGLVSKTLDRKPEGPCHLLFCGHGIPMSFAASADPYPAEIDRTVAAVRRAFPSLPASLAWQGRTGRGRWLEPYAFDEVGRLGSEGLLTLVVVPVSFVSDHSETLFELDIELKEKAEASGIKTYLRVPALNDAPAFVAALRDIALKALA